MLLKYLQLKLDKSEKFDLISDVSLKHLIFPSKCPEAWKASAFTSARGMQPAAAACAAAQHLRRFQASVNGERGRWAVCAVQIEMNLCIMQWAPRRVWGMHGAA